MGGFLEPRSSKPSLPVHIVGNLSYPLPKWLRQLQFRCSQQSDTPEASLSCQLTRFVSGLWRSVWLFPWPGSLACVLGVSPWAPSGPTFVPVLCGFRGPALCPGMSAGPSLHCTMVQAADFVDTFHCNLGQWDQPGGFAGDSFSSQLSLGWRVEFLRPRLHGLPVNEAIEKEKGGLATDIFLNLFTYEQDDLNNFWVMGSSKSQRVSNSLGLECLLCDQHSPDWCPTGQPPSPMLSCNPWFPS